MRSYVDEQLEALRAMCQGWDVWTVRLATQKRTLWCARPKGHPVATINTDSPENLIEAIREQEATKQAH
jgi:hypothetical protein